jgi:exosortase A-associated hydrolase 1
MERIMRRMIGFDCAGDRLIGTLDEASGTTGLLIVSGGNEIRSGAYAGQAAMAAHFAALGCPVFRYDRRGIGDSEGENGGFENSADDIAAAVASFRQEAPTMQRLIAFGNCDAATALALFHGGLPIDALVLANPWVIENAAQNTGEDTPTPPSAAAIRARYWNRLKNPRSLIDLFTGKINLKKLAGGLAKAAQAEKPSALADQLAKALGDTKLPVNILIAERDTTAMAFMAAWKNESFAEARAGDRLKLSTYPTASHSFADNAAKVWLWDQIEQFLAS